MRIVTVIVSAVLASAIAAGIAFAVRPVAGATYKGSVQHAGVTIGISFKVSARGTKVTSLKLDVPNLPNKCGYGGVDTVAMTKPAAIKNGRFTAKLTEKSVIGRVAATAKVTGRFLAQRREKGTIATTDAANASCSGSFGYSTKAR